MNIAFFIVESALFGLFVWLGLFLLNRVFLQNNTSGTMWRYPALYCGIGALLFAGFLLGVAMQSIATTAADYVLWQKLTWWTVPLGAAFYVGATLLLYIHLQSGSYPALLRWKSYWVLLAPACMIAYGTTGDWFLDYDRLTAVVTPYEAFHAPFRLPHYYVYALFVASLLVGSSLVLFRRQPVLRWNSSATSRMAMVQRQLPTASTMRINRPSAMWPLGLPAPPRCCPKRGHLSGPSGQLPGGMDERQRQSRLSQHQIRDVI